MEHLKNLNAIDVIYWIAHYLHAFAVLGLFIKVWWTQNYYGISLKSQCLCALAFTTRYLDLFTAFISLQHTIVKAIFIVATYGTVLAMLLFSETYEKKYDTFRVEILIIPCFMISFWINRAFTVLEVLWAFSIYLEAVAMLPQFRFFTESKRIHRYMILYIAATSVYKGLFVAYWNFQYYYNHESYEIHIAASIVQLLLNCDFFLRIMPRLAIQRDQDPRTRVAHVEDDSESAIPDNQSNPAVFRPDPKLQSNKGNLLTIEEVDEKC